MSNLAKLSSLCDKLTGYTTLNKKFERESHIWKNTGSLPALNYIHNGFQSLKLCRA
ncbi:hypothetical protein THOB06_10323 [Vibrio rotiferianus]|nr:hypothetical protein THOG10_10323 [Vibrio rotiferianus]CAH1557065.1 hypothetical protein THOB06_10323 [Vibrio rotiferianus]